MRFRLRAIATLSALAAMQLGAAGLPGTGLLSIPVAAADAARASAVPGPVVLLGTGGLSWGDVEAAKLPTLSGLLATGATGWLADRSVRAVTCQVDGWLAVSAGKRAADVDTRASAGQKYPTCRQPLLQISTPGGAASVPQWPDYLRQAKADSYQANPGLLGETLAQAGKSVAAVGPGAGIALADPHGQLARAWAGDGTGNPALDPSVIADVKAALATKPDLLVVDLGVTRDHRVRDVDTRLGMVLDQLPADATVLIASVADSGAPSQLQLLAARGPAALGGDYANALLGSSSTRQDALAQTTDLTPTMLAALGVPIPDEAVGAALKPVEADASPAHRRQKLDDVGRASSSIKPIVPWFFNGLVIAQLLLYGISTVVIRRRSERTDQAAVLVRRRALRRLRWGSVVFAAVPAATFLANLLPWWRSSTPGLAVTGATILFVVPIAALALFGPWRNALLGPMGVVGAVTAAVLGIDVITKSHLMLSSLMGVQPVIAGRFYGFGNPAFAVFVTGALLAAISIADAQVRVGRARFGAAAVVAIGIGATIADGTPGFGSDFGGPPAIIPAFAVLALLVLGVKVSWRRALLIALVTITVIVSLSLLDWARGPGNRTHLGRFVQTIIDGGAWPVIQRKADQNVKILFTSWLTALLPFAVAFVVLVLARPVALGVRPLQLAYDRSPVLRHGVLAFGILMLLAAGLNDSGLAIPAVAAMVAIPLLITASVRTLEFRDDESPRPPTPPPLSAPPDPAMAPHPGGSPE